MLVLWFIQILQTVPLEQFKSDGKFQTRFVEGVPFVNKRCTKGVPFLLKMVYEMVKGLNFGAELPHWSTFYFAHQIWVGVVASRLTQTPKEYSHLDFPGKIQHFSKFVRRRSSFHSHFKPCFLWLLELIVKSRAGWGRPPAALLLGSYADVLGGASRVSAPL